MNSKEIISKYKLDKSTWTFKGFHAILYTFFPVAEGALLGPTKQYGYDFEMGLFFTKGDYVNWYWHDNSMNSIRKKFIEEVNSNPNFLKDLRKRWLVLKDKHYSYMDKLEKINFAELNDKDLLNHSDKLHKLYCDSYGICMAPVDAFSMYADQFLEPLFMQILERKNKVELFHNYYPILMSPVDKSFVTEEEEDLLKILIKKRKGEDIDKDLEEHQQKYFWITNNYAIQIKQNVQFFKDKLLKLHNKIKDPEKELKKADNHIENIKAQKQEIIKELKLDKEFLNLIKISELFAYMQDQRKEGVTICNHYQRLFFEEIGKRLNIPTDEMENTVYSELREMLIDKKFDRKVLQSRKRHSLCIFPKDDWKVFDGKVVDEIYKEIFEVKSEGIDELKGTVASKGIASGKIRLIHKIKDMEHMQKGEIIVSSMTRPEMVVAMKKAAAIVTDEGGITSHAAIVSRELGIPCILGTKIATKVFKNGDIAEVDANNGIVRKLN